MAIRFDATLKLLAAAGPQGFLGILDVVPAQRVSMLNVDLSTVTRAADLVFGVGNPLVEIIHVDCQSSADSTKHLDVLLYNALLYSQYKVPVHSIVLLLRKKARHRNLNGMVRYASYPERGKMEFAYFYSSTLKGTFL